LGLLSYVQQQACGQSKICRRAGEKPGPQAPSAPAWSKAEERNLK
jgi:hypothetical protein